MSILSLTKQYSDQSLLFKEDIDIMWDELEAKVNGGIDSDNVAQDWATLSQVALAKDVSFTLGATDSIVLRFYSSDNSLNFLHDTTMRDMLFKIDSTTVGTLDTSGNLSVSKDIYFYNKSTSFPLSYLIGYCKPVLVYTDSTTVSMEQNTVTSGQSLIIFPSGPVAVTEDISSTHKFRQLKLSATANGYSTSHTGAADSGMKVGVSLTANTWYFVYAVIVRGGDDTGKFIMVVDTTNPMPTNWTSLNSTYGTGNWIYLGLLRYGYQAATTTTLIPFIQDKTGWTYFKGRSAVDNFFGIQVAASTAVTTSATTLYTNAIANSGAAIPQTCSAFQMAARVLPDGDDEMAGRIYVEDGSGNTIITMMSFSSALEADEVTGWHAKLPNVAGITFKGIAFSSTDDFNAKTYISAVLDEYV